MDKPADKKGGPYVRDMEAALGQAIVLARGNRNAEAARVYGDAIAHAPRGSVGWLLPVEPLLHPRSARGGVGWVAATDASTESGDLAPRIRRRRS